MTVDVDVTHLLEVCAGEEASFFAATLHVLVEAANAVPSLRQRIRVESGVDVVVEHDRVDPAFTVPVDGGLFNFATVPFTSDYLAFQAAVGEVSAAQRTNPELEPFEEVRDDVLYMTCLPWMHFRSMTHPVHTDRPDAVPRIAWGRYTRTAQATTLPLNIQVHHALVDGRHLGHFFDEVRERLSSFTVRPSHGA